MDILDSLFISIIFMASVLWISLWYDYEFSFFSFTAYSKLYANVEGSGWWLTLHIRHNLWLSTVKAGNLNQNNVWDYSNLRSHIQSHKLVQMSGMHCHMHASSTSDSVCFTVEHCIEHSRTVSLFQAQDGWKQE